MVPENDVYGFSPSTAVVAFYTDYAKAKGEFPVLRRNKAVRVRTKTGGEYTFSYAPLEEILRVEPVLAKHGFTLSQREIEGFVETTLAHKDGYFISGRTKMQEGANEGPQAHGSALTYARRYGVTLLLCLATDEDDDGNAAEGNEIKQGHTKANPRDGMDLSGVDQELAQQYAQDIRKALVEVDEPTLKSLHEKLKTQQELYTVVWGLLKAREREDVRKIVSKKEAA